ncbi:MAG: hypothetical protein H7232_16215 [Aeromicrobium sp.]|nr:hypothetical protein [Burkholderiales bacterium]
MGLSYRGLFIVLGVALLAGAGANSLLGLFALTTLGVGLWLLWRPGLSPIFIFIFGYQWLQASTKVFQASLHGLNVEDLSAFGGDVSTATALSLVGLVMLAFGMWAGLGRAGAWQATALDAELQNKPQNFWFRCYGFAFIAALMVQSVTYVIPALSQPLLALASLKWAFFWILTHVAFGRAASIRGLWLLAFAAEFALGIGGYFSSFKTVIFFTIFGVLSSGFRLSATRLLGLGAIGIVTLILGVTWSAIKTEQRDFLNQGQMAQVVSVSYLESVANMAQLVQRLDATAMADAAVGMADRLAYVDFFALVLDVVPAEIPYEKGALWGDAVARPFMPRLLFADKTIIDDSERTAYYTRRRVGSAEDGTSVSLGYMAESYIDFGPWLMMPPIFALGWMLGRFYRWMVEYRRSRGAFGTGLAIATLFQAAFLESSITKLFGGLVVAMLMSWVVARWFVPKFYTAPKNSLQPPAAEAR